MNTSKRVHAVCQKLHGNEVGEKKLALKKKWNEKWHILSFTAISQTHLTPPNVNAPRCISKSIFPWFGRSCAWCICIFLSIFFFFTTSPLLSNPTLDVKQGGKKRLDLKILYFLILLTADWGCQLHINSFSKETKVGYASPCYREDYFFRCYYLWNYTVLYSPFCWYQTFIFPHLKKSGYVLV